MQNRLSAFRDESPVSHTFLAARLLIAQSLTYHLRKPVVERKKKLANLFFSGATCFQEIREGT